MSDKKESNESAVKEPRIIITHQSAENNENREDFSKIQTGNKSYGDDTEETVYLRYEEAPETSQNDDLDNFTTNTSLDSSSDSNDSDKIANDSTSNSDVPQDVENYYQRMREHKREAPNDLDDKEKEPDAVNGLRQQGEELRKGNRLDDEDEKPSQASENDSTSADGKSSNESSTNSEQSSDKSKTSRSSQAEGGQKENKIKNKASQAGENANKQKKTFGGSDKAVEKGTPNARQGMSSATHPISSRVNDLKSAVDNRINKLKNMPQQMANAAKKKAKEATIAFIKNVILPNLIPILIGVLIFLLLILILGAIAGAVAGSEEESESYIDPLYDFNATVVTLTNSYSIESDKIVLQESVTLKDLIMGATYYEFYGSLSGMSEEDAKEIYKAYMVVMKSLALSKGGYSSDTKEITIQSGDNGIAYCDIYNGCDIIRSNDMTTIVSKSYTGTINGMKINEILSASDKKIELLKEAYDETSSILLTPTDVNYPITTYNFGDVPYNQSIEQGWITYKLANESATYAELLTSTSDYSNLKTYDASEYTETFEYTDFDTNNALYWWPIGSKEPDSNGLYSGQPLTTTITSHFYRKNGDWHGALDIGGGGCNVATVIASRTGKVILMNDSCPTIGKIGSKCGQSYGNYVKIKHDDGVETLYAHMAKGSIVVNTGDTVVQGQKLGMMGSSGSSSGCHTHFEIRINGTRVDPEQYVSASKPRETAILNETKDQSNSKYIVGNKNVRSVCLALNSRNYSYYAIAGIMANMSAESNFNPTIVGDSGTSYGLCQWHNGRYSNLKNFCGKDYSSIKCQLDYLNNELKNSYKDVYYNLQNTKNAHEMVEYYCKHFEVPANTNVECKKRAEERAEVFYQYALNGCN